MGNRGGGRKQKQKPKQKQNQKQNKTTNSTSLVVVRWKKDNYLSTNPDLKREIEDAVRDKAPERAYYALIRCGWHESTSDCRNHATVDYKIGLPDGRTEPKTKHIYP